MAEETSTTAETKPAVAPAPAADAVASAAKAAEPASKVAAEPAPAAKLVEAPVAKPVAAPVVKAEAAPVSVAPAAKPVVEAAKPAPVRPKAAPAKAPAPARDVKPVPARAVKKPLPARTRRAAPAKAPVAAAVVAKAGRKKAAPVIASKPKPTSSVSPAKPVAAAIKDNIMAKTIPTDFIATFQSAFGDMQTKAKTAYEKGTEAFGDANDFAKGNIEAVVQSGKILASGLQELGATMVADSRSAFDTVSAEVKELAAAKTPSDFLSLQSALLRKNFDSAIAQASKNTEAMLKLVTDAVTPLSGRVAVAVEKVGKAA